MGRLYDYVGPEAIRASNPGPPGSAITTRDDVIAWVTSQGEEPPITATFVVGEDGLLRLAPRRSEHVACAGGGRVAAAGEMVVDRSGEIAEVSNQSTGYCPEPTCWGRGPARSRRCRRAPSRPVDSAVRVPAM